MTTNSAQAAGCAVLPPLATRAPWRGAGPRPDRSWVCLQRVEELGDEGNGRVAVYVPVGDEQRSGARVEEGACKPREGIAAARCCRAHQLASASSVTAPRRGDCLRLEPRGPAHEAHYPA